MGCKSGTSLPSHFSRAAKTYVRLFKMRKDRHILANKASSSCIDCFLQQHIERRFEYYIV